MEAIPTVKDKYQHRHEITKSIPKEFREIADSAIDHLGRFLDNLNARDLIYLISYFAAVQLIYFTIKGITIPLESLMRISGTNVLGMPRRTTTGGLETIAQEIDNKALLLSLVGAYGLLKLDLGDVTSAVSKITSAVGVVAAI